MTALDRLPERLRPFDVVVTVEIAAADRRRGKLEPPEKEADDEGAGYKLSDLYGRPGFKLGGCAGGVPHQWLKLVFNSQLIDQLE
jgi:hypothetical protein